MTCFDTSFLIALERGHEGAREILRERTGHGPLLVPAVAWTEYLTGVEPKQWPLAAEVLRASARVVPFTEDLAREAARLQQACIAAGRQRAWADVQIAATAIHANVALATMDSDFDGVPGVEVLRP